MEFPITNLTEFRIVNSKVNGSIIGIYLAVYSSSRFDQETFEKTDIDIIMIQYHMHSWSSIILKGTSINLKSSAELVDI